MTRQLFSTARAAHEWAERMAKLCATEYGTTPTQCVIEILDFMDSHRVWPKDYTCGRYKASSAHSVLTALAASCGLVHALIETLYVGVSHAAQDMHAHPVRADDSTLLQNSEAWSEAWLKALVATARREPGAAWNEAERLQALQYLNVELATRLRGLRQEELAPAGVVVWYCHKELHSMVERYTFRLAKKHYDSVKAEEKGAHS